MAKLGLQCHTEHCPIYINGPAKLDRKAAANPNIAKHVQMAKKEYGAIETAKQQAAEEIKSRKRGEEAAEYAKYDPFSGGPWRLPVRKRRLASSNTIEDRKNRKLGLGKAQCSTCHASMRQLPSLIIGWIPFAVPILDWPALLGHRFIATKTCMPPDRKMPKGA